MHRGVDKFLGLGGLISKDKRAAILLKGEGAGGGCAPSCTKCRSKIFFQNPRGVREQIRVLICTEG